MTRCPVHCPSGGDALAVVVPVAVAAVVVVFVLAHLALLAGCAAAFVVVMGGVIAGMRWVASPRRMRQQLHPQAVRRTLPAAPARAITAPPRAIEAARVIPAHVVIGPGRGARPQAPGAVRR